ncbi:MAG: cysteine desulfurase [Planctomycetes bacterium]|nr:cysteine desulfurase [Planctomycetota bacterium]
MNVQADTIAQMTSTSFDPNRIIKDFPILRRKVHGKRLVYLDNAATSQKPQSVINTVSRHYQQTNANIHRGIHTLSVESTNAYEAARGNVQRFINASRPEEIIFVRGATEAINLVAQTYGRSTLKKGDEILISTMEHHSNIVPWQILCEQTGAILRVAPINDAGELMFSEYEQMLSQRTKIVAITHISNALGTINPIRKITEAAHKHGAIVLVDGAQAAPHMPIDVQDISCDFYAITGHKMFGPVGIGALYGRHEMLNQMPPYQGGGEMILSVTFEKTTYNHVPHKFEAGTPNIVGAIGFGSAIDYLNAIGMENIAAYEQELLAYATAALQEIDQVQLIGTAQDKAAILSFTVGDIHPHDVGTVLDQEGVAVRTGNHCAQPAVERFGHSATVRASLALYNTKEDIDALTSAIRKTIELLG